MATKNLSQNNAIFIHKNEFENNVCKMANIYISLDVVTESFLLVDFIFQSLPQSTRSRVSRCVMTVVREKIGSLYCQVTRIPRGPFTGFD